MWICQRYVLHLVGVYCTHVLAFIDFIEFINVANFVVVFVVVHAMVVTTTVPKNETCTCPCLHWPPVIPPIFAILISILMIPCYCYSCGPWSGPYWAEERRKHQPRQLCSRPTATNAYNAGARFRPLTNGYGAFWVTMFSAGDETICYC